MQISYVDKKICIKLLEGKFSAIFHTLLQNSKPDTYKPTYEPANFNMKHCWIVGVAQSLLAATMRRSYPRRSPGFHIWTFMCCSTHLCICSEHTSLLVKLLYIFQHYMSSRIVATSFSACNVSFSWMQHISSYQRQRARLQICYKNSGSQR